MPSQIPLPLADKAGGLQSADFGHLDIHQHSIKTLTIERLQRFAAVCPPDDLVAVPFEQPHRQLLIDRVVLREKKLEPRRDSEVWQTLRAPRNLLPGAGAPHKVQQ